MADPHLIEILLAANTGILGIAAVLLFKRLDSMEESITNAHKRIDSHVVDHAQHTISITK